MSRKLQIAYLGVGFFFDNPIAGASYFCCWPDAAA